MVEMLRRSQKSAVRSQRSEVCGQVSESEMSVLVVKKLATPADPRRAAISAISAEKVNSKVRETLRFLNHE